MSTYTNVLIEDLRTKPNVEQVKALEQAYKGSWYTISGASDVQQFVDGYNDLLEEGGIGTATRFVVVTGAAVNDYIGILGMDPGAYPTDLTVILFPSSGLDVGKLAMFKIRMQDRWFDDIVQNARRQGMI